MNKVLMIVYLSCSRGSSHNPTSNNVHNHALKPQQHQHQQQLLLMRVSSVKSAPKNQNSNNNTKKDNATELRTNNEDIHQVHGQQGNLAWPDYLGQTALQTLWVFFLRNDAYCCVGLWTPSSRLCSSSPPATTTRFSRSTTPTMPRTRRAKPARVDRWTLVPMPTLF